MSGANQRPEGQPADVDQWPERTTANLEQIQTGHAASKGTGKGYGKYTEVARTQGPSPVPDEHGLENLLVHVIGISGEWLWSDVIPEHTPIWDVQKRFQNSDLRRFGFNDGHWFKLLYQVGRAGPYPRGSERATFRGFYEPSYLMQVHLGAVTDILRSSETREVWITAIKVLVI